MNNEPELEIPVEHEKSAPSWLLMTLVVTIVVGGLIASVMSESLSQSLITGDSPQNGPGTTQSPPIPSGPTTQTPSEQPPPKEDNVGPKWDYVSLTPEIFNKIIQKIRGASNSEIKTTIPGELGSITFYYSFVTHDPCDPLLKDFLVLEIETTSYADENGKKYPNGPIADRYTMRDTDHDTFPEDYFTPGENPVTNPCYSFLPLTGDTPDIDGLLSLWEAGMNYFAVNLLK